MNDFLEQKINLLATDKNYVLENFYFVRPEGRGIKKKLVTRKAKYRFVAADGLGVIVDSQATLKLN